MEKLQRALQKARTQREGGGAAPATASTSAPATAPDSGTTPAPGTISAAASPAPAASTPSRNRRAQKTVVPASDAASGAWSALHEFVPDPDLLHRNRVMTLFANRDATPFDILRTKIRLLMEQNGWTRIAITSPTAGCGKTTVAANLAIGFGRQPDLRAMLFELDLRRPGLAKCLGLAPPDDVVRLMRGDVDASAQLVRIGQNVGISAAARASKDPTSVLLDRRTTRIMSEIEEEFAPDIVLFDLPPLLVSDDSRAFLKEVDCVLIVAEAEKTTVAQLDTCEREILEHTNVLGTVLNQCRLTTSSAAVDSYDYE